MAAVDKIDWETKTSDEEKGEANGVFTTPILEEETEAVQLIYNSLRESVDKTNAHINEIALNTAKVSLGAANANSLSFTYNTKTGNLDITVVVSSKLTKRATITLK